MIRSSVFSSIAVFSFHFLWNIIRWVFILFVHSAILLYISFNLFCLWKLFPCSPVPVPGPNSLSYWNGWDCQILIKTFLSLLSPLKLEFAFLCQPSGARASQWGWRNKEEGKRAGDSYVYSLCSIIWNQENHLTINYNHSSSVKLIETRFRH